MRTAVLIVVVAAASAFTVQSACRHFIHCPCGNTGRSVTVCADEINTENPCRKWIGCKKCQDWLDGCLECPEGFEGHWCSQATVYRKQSRQKRLSMNFTFGANPFRQNPVFSRNPMLPSVSEKVACDDPGFITDGYRRNMKGRRSTVRRTFQDEEFVIFSCTSEDFCLQGSPFLICEKGLWSDSLPQCIKSEVNQPMCGIPFPISNGQAFFYPASSESKGIDEAMPVPDEEELPQGSTLQYACDSGYTMNGVEWLTCESTGYWSGIPPSCNRDVSASCLDPGVDPNGERNPDFSPNRLEFRPGTDLEFFCNEDFELEGEESIVCEASGQWSSSIPKCVALSSSSDVMCCDGPDPISNGTVKPSFQPDLRKSCSQPPGETEVYPGGTVLKYSCENGYHIEGSPELYCMSTGNWTSDPPSCETVSSEVVLCCDDPGPISNGRVTLSFPPSLPRSCSGTPDKNTEYPHGTVLKYSCEDGYRMEGSLELHCMSTGIWTSEPPSCEIVSSEDVSCCEDPGPIPNGRVKLSFPPNLRRLCSRPHDKYKENEGYPQGTVLKYSCRDGYQIERSPELYCMSTGIWTSDPPFCEIDCGRSSLLTSFPVTNNTIQFVGEWPWMVSVATREGEHICGGVLLNNRAVLTAAHCVSKATSYALYFGKFQLNDVHDDAEVDVRISNRIVPHPDFSKTTYDSDIAFVTFAPEIRFTERVRPICLPTRETTAKNMMTGNIGYVTGWGEHYETNRPAKQLRLIQLPIQSSSLCMEHMNPIAVTFNMFCAGYEEGGQNTCRGDSGAPFVFLNSDISRYTLEGLVSFGLAGQCGMPKRYTVFVKVLNFVPWILRNINA